MAILRAYAFPHPPLAIPAVGKGEEGKIQATLSAFDEAAAEIAALAPETLVFITPHSVLYRDYFHISPGGGALGSFARFGIPEARFVEYDAALAEEIARLAENAGLAAGPFGERDEKLDLGVMVPLWFLGRRFQNHRIVRISQSGMDAAAHYRLGQCIAQAADKTDRRAVLIASGDLSHKLQDGSPYGFASEGPAFDNAVTAALGAADFLSLFAIPERVRERAAECGYNSLMVLAGCLDCREVDARLFSYEGPFGVGYAVAGFAPGEADESRNFLEQYENIRLAQVRERQRSEDCYRSLARQSLEFRVQNGRTLPLPDGLPSELLQNRAGVFVSLHKNGRLRGCVGTVTPEQENIALEIIQCAVLAGLSDRRFEPVTADELPHLVYKVDVLSAPEPISGSEALDIRRYGVIVSAGDRRGLLLPNLEGIDTVAKQITIARKKAGIAAGANVRLERFEVVRHE